MEFDGESLRLFDHGHRWIRAHPLHAPLGVIGDALTVLLDAAGQPLELCVDIHQGAGIAADTGLPWIDDQYLDVAGLLSSDWQPRHLLLFDEDELAAAVLGRAVSEAQSAAAYVQARAGMAGLTAGSYAPLQAVRSRHSRHAVL